MTTSSRLAAHRANAPAIVAKNGGEQDQIQPPDTPGDDEALTTTETENSDMTDITMPKADFDKAVADASAAASARYNAVLTSEHYAGREKIAATLLAKPALSAEDITATLAEIPVAAPVAADVENDAGAEAVLAALRESGNADLGADGGGKPPEPKNHGWDEIRAEMGMDRPKT